MADIGFSTSCLRLIAVPFNDRVKFYHSIGATAIELSFRLEHELDSEYNALISSPETLETLKKFNYVSIHAPSVEDAIDKVPVTYKPSKRVDVIIIKLRQLCDLLPINGIVIHPHLVKDFGYLEETGLPFLLENMDNKKAFGTHPDHFRQLAETCNLGFVLDTQHVYTNGSTKKLTKEFISLMGDRLMHMHVAGHTNDKSHAPVHISENKHAIVKILKLGIGVPKVSEGRLLSQDFARVASKELKFMRQYER